LIKPTPRRETAETMRAIWTGAIGFGLVNIPVRLYSSIQESELDLDLLDKKDHAHIRFKRVNEETGKEVAWNNIVKAYQYKGNYVVLQDKDFEKASAKKSKIIEITDFVAQEQVDNMLYETPYYLEPDKSGTKAYALLRDALAKSGKVGVGSFVLRTKEHLCLLQPRGKIIILYRLRFPEEIRDIAPLKIPEAKNVKPAELKMAMSLIDQLSGRFNVKKYKNNYAAALKKVIQAKAKGKKVSYPDMKVTYSKSKDIMHQLKASIESHKRKAS